LNEDDLPIGPPPSWAAVPSPEIVAQKLCTVEDMLQMKVIELKTKLKLRELSVNGKKEALVARLKEAVEKGMPFQAKLLIKEERSNMVGDGFSLGAHWVELHCDGEFIDEKNPDGYRAPTINQGGNYSVHKRNYTQKFDRMVFSGRTELPATKNKRGDLKKQDGKVVFEKRPHDRTEVKMAFVRKHKLDVDSHPALWFDAFLPRMRKVQNNEVAYSMEHSLEWTNARASQEAKYRKKFKNFQLEELIQHVGIYLLQAPQVEMKFYSQCNYPVNGSDFAHSSFGSRPTTMSERRHRHFKAFFCQQSIRSRPG